MGNSSSPTAYRTTRKQMEQRSNARPKRRRARRGEAAESTAATRESKRTNDLSAGTGVCACARFYSGVNGSKRVAAETSHAALDVRERKGSAGRARDEWHAAFVAVLWCRGARGTAQWSKLGRRGMRSKHSHGVNKRIAASIVYRWYVTSIGC